MSRQRIQEQYFERTKATTKKEWEAQMAKFEGKVNVESLLMEGIKNGWLPMENEDK